MSPINWTKWLRLAVGLATIVLATILLSSLARLPFVDRAMYVPRIGMDVDLAVCMVALLRMMIRNRVRPEQRNKDAGKEFYSVLRLFGVMSFFAFELFLMQGILFYRARGELRRRLDALDPRHVRVQVAGQASPQPQLVLNALRGLQGQGRWRKRLKERTEIEVLDGRDTIALIVARAEFQEYWIMYPRYRSTAANDIAAFYYWGDLFEDALQPPPDAAEAAALPTNASAEEATNEEDSPACGLNATAGAEQD